MQPFTITANVKSLLFMGDCNNGTTKASTEPPKHNKTQTKALKMLLNLLILLLSEGNPLKVHCFDGDGGHYLSQTVKGFDQASPFLKRKKLICNPKSSVLW